MLTYFLSKEQKKLKLSKCVKIPINNSPILIFVQTVLKLMISLKKGHEIYHLTNYHLFPHSALWQPLAVQDLLMHNDIAH